MYEGIKGALEVRYGDNLERPKIMKWNREGQGNSVSCRKLKEMKKGREMGEKSSVCIKISETGMAIWRMLFGIQWRMQVLRM